MTDNPPVSPTPESPEPTAEEIAEWTRRSEHAKAHPETLIPLEQMRERIGQLMLSATPESEQIGEMLDEFAKQVALGEENYDDADEYSAWKRKHDAARSEILSLFTRLQAENELFADSYRFTRERLERLRKDTLTPEEAAWTQYALPREAELSKTGARVVAKLRRLSTEKP